jgi:tRNA(Arg) A34 adenosine deaminase TadA
MNLPQVTISLPDWVATEVDLDAAYASDEARMRLAIELSRQNVLRGTGGPFGAVVFERESGRVVGAGVNSVVRLNNCTLHGEMMAFMQAQARLGSFSLRAPGGPEHELVTSCEPCAMCLGATLWSGVTRVVCGAHRDDARRLNFEEGPVFPESHAYLEARGIEIVHGVLRDEANAVLELYRARKGTIYNG